MYSGLQYLTADSFTIPSLTQRDEQKVRKGLDRLVKYVTDHQRWNVHAIILTGSLPSGWGAPPHSDLDVLVITRIYDLFFNRRVHAALQGIELPCKFEVVQSPSMIFNRMPSVSRFDLRETGRLIYGDRNVLELSKRVILPKYEALKYLFNNAVVNLISGMDPEFFSNEKCSEDHEDEIFRKSVKAYLAICCGLLILCGKYQTGYPTRERYFTRAYHELYPNLHAEIPDLADKIKFSTDYKLGKKPAEVAEKSTFFRECIDDAAFVVKHALRVYFDAPSEDELNTVLLLDRFPHNWVNSVYYYTRYLTELRRQPPLACLFEEPIVEVYTSSLCVLLAANDRNPAKYLSTARSRISRLFSPLPFTGKEVEDWDLVRRTCVLLHPQMLIVPQMRYRRDP